MLGDWTYCEYPYEQPAEITTHRGVQGNQRRKRGKGRWISLFHVDSTLNSLALSSVRKYYCSLGSENLVFHPIQPSFSVTAASPYPCTFQNDPRALLLDPDNGKLALI
ncbi:hypothetical protein Mapa_006498 [Marchantia paleacea]|nr:hypothetical protein Mapa_006498 [Marchantia paleacea]